MTRAYDEVLAGIFGQGLSMIIEQGYEPERARAFLGRLVKLHGKQQVAAAIERARQALPVDMLTWLSKAAALPADPPRQVTYRLDDGREITVAAETRIVWNTDTHGAINGYQTPSGTLHLVIGRASRRRP